MYQCCIRWVYKYAANAHCKLLVATCKQYLMPTFLHFDCKTVKHVYMRRMPYVDENIHLAAVLNFLIILAEKKRVS